MNNEIVFDGSFLSIFIIINKNLKIYLIFKEMNINIKKIEDVFNIFKLSGTQMHFTLKYIISSIL